jgi:hypothetical protein
MERHENGRGKAEKNGENMKIKGQRYRTTKKKLMDMLADEEEKEKERLEAGL